MSKTSPILVGLEIGTSKICAAIGEENERGEFTLLGIGQAKSHGVRKGEIGRASCREECERLCRSRWSPYH